MPVARPKAPELPQDEKLVAIWRKRLDTTKTSIKEFKEAYRVPTKRRKIGETASNLVRFREYPLQTMQREAYEKQWAAGMGGRVCSCKGRQEGMSTDAALSVWERFMRGGGGTANLFSYDTDATKELLRLFHSFRRQTPPWVFTELVHGGGGKWKRESAMQLQLEFPDGTDTMIQCLTAGDKASGAGSSPRWLLWDEFPKWKAEVKRDPTSMSEGWQAGPENFWIVQGTGMGQDEYAEFFTRVYGGDQESGFVAIFPQRGWLGHPDRREEFQSPRQREQFMERIGKDKSYGIKDEERLVAAGATPEELYWRRRKVAGIAIKWDLQLMRREFPLVPSDAFESSSRTVFAGQIDILKSHEAPSKERERQAVSGELELTAGGKVRFVPSPHGPVLVFEEPKPGVDYCFGCDPSSGKTRPTVGNKETDFTHASFGPVVASPPPTVARLRGHLTQRVGAEELFKLCCWYNGARGFVESNVGEVLIQFMRDMTHGQWLGEDFLLARGEAPTALHGKAEKVIGWMTSVKSREAIIAAVEGYLVEAREYVPGSVSPFDPMEVAECLVFERNEKGKAEAARGHDDAIFALGLRELARRHLIESGEVEVLARVNPRARALDASEQMLADEREYGQQRDPVRVIVDPEKALLGQVAFKKDTRRSKDLVLGDLYG